MTTLDFHIKPTGENAFSLEVFRRDSSQPVARSSFEYDTSYLTQFEINQLEPDPRDPQGRLDRLATFGKRLYDKVFTPPVKQLWEKLKHESDFLVLCIRIDPHAKDLETLPWETLYDGTEFLAAGVKTGVSRLPLDVAIQESVPAVPAPLKMLAIVSSPLDLEENERLQIEGEQEILLQAVNAPSGQGKLVLEMEDEAKLPVIEGSLEGGCHILHYSGHGIPPEGGGGLLLEDAQGNRRPTAVAEIMQSLEKAEHTLRFVVISGCQTAKTLNIRGFQDLARGLLRRHIPAAVAMQFSISDAAGLIFAENLYPRLVEGHALDIAVSGARRAILQNDNATIQGDAFAPVLFAANSRPLTTTKAEDKEAIEEPKIDFALHLPLPQLSFGFYGRRREYRAIRDGIIARNHRAVIVYGIGGIGKTALISHTAERLKDHFRGIYAFDCSSGALAPETILLELHRYLERQGINVLGPLLHQSIPPDQLGSFVGQVLSQAPLLLIFDNFGTHLTPQSEQRHKIADESLGVFLKTLVKTTATGTRFLFTTRYLFDLDSKQLRDIQEVSLGDLSRPEALGLMQRLPHLSNASFADKLKTFDTFGGHPYALVTLDRHCSHRPVADVLEDAKDVHAELREFLAIELNYRKLSDRARELLNRLAAFRKPVPVAAAEWVMGQKVDEEVVARQVFANPQLNPEMKKLGEAEFVRQHKASMPEMRRAESIGEPVGELIGWGLLTPIAEDGKVAGCAVHSLVRDFCRDKVGAEAWKANLCDAASYYTNQTKLLLQDQKSPGAVWMEMEAFELLFEAEEYDEAARLLVEAHAFLNRWGFRRFLESLYRRVIPEIETSAKSIVTHNLGVLLQERGDYEGALGQYQWSLGVLEKLGDRAGIAKSLQNLGTIQQQRGDFGAALEHYDKSLRITEELGDRAGVSTCLHQIGNIHYLRSDFEKALEYYQESLKTDEELGDRAGAAMSIHQIGMIHEDRGDYDNALRYYEQALGVKEELGDRAGVARSFHQIGTISQRRGDYEKALQYYQKSLKTFEELGDRAAISTSLYQIGTVLATRGDYKAALQHYQTSLKGKEELGDRMGAARCFLQIAQIYQQRGDYEAALRESERSQKILASVGDREGVAISHGQIGRLLTETGEYAQALENSLAAFSTFATSGSQYAAVVLGDLRILRYRWGPSNFDKAWTEGTGQPVPEGIK